MKKLILFLLFFQSLHTYATIYFVAPMGKDNNPGTLTQPFATIQQAQSAVHPGDTVYLRGGAYHIPPNQIARQERIYACVSFLDKSGEPGKYINYWAYPGERPIFDNTAVRPADLRVAAFYVTASWLHLKGFDVTGVQVTIKTHTQSECFENHGSNNIFEQLSMHDGMAIGFYLLSGADNLILNCDAYRNFDNFSENGRGGNTDGFGCHPAAGGKGNTFRGCRAWNNSDDGYDVINSHEASTFENCWAFYNGFTPDFTSEGDGNGFKMGGYGKRPASEIPDPVPQNTVRFCLAVRNKASGFYSNHHINGSFWVNNTAYRNNVNFNMLNRLPDNVTDVPGYKHVMRNNLGYRGNRELANFDSSKCDLAGNYFDLGLQATDADFISLDETQLMAPRQSDGSLPEISFMHLRPGSQFIDKGVDAGFPFKGRAPDLGAFESGGTPATVALNWLDITPVEPAGVSWGMPWPQGIVTPNTGFALIQGDGNSRAVQSWPLAYWPDGSVKWTGFAAIADSSAKNLSLKILSEKNADPVQRDRLQIIRGKDGEDIRINTGAMQAVIARKGRSVIRSIIVNGKEIAADGRLECILQDHPDADIEGSVKRKNFTGTVTDLKIEQDGPLRAVIKVEGKFISATGDRSWLPFILRLYFYQGVQNIRIVHTLIFDGDDQKDFIKGLGLVFNVPFREELQNRHVRFGGEGEGIWAEPVQPLGGRRPNPYSNDQAMGRPVPNLATVNAGQRTLFHDMAAWNDFKLVQANADGFTIQKRTGPKGSWLDVVGGHRASGLVYIGDVSGGLALSLKDFWQTYPTALEVSGARTPEAKITCWLWSPHSDAMDLRHYDTTAHGLDYTYEDVQPGFSTPHGIGRTSEITLYPYSAMPDNRDLAGDAAMGANTMLLVATPHYLHQVGALGLWSLPDRSTRGKGWIEDQLDKAIAFYQQEIDRREWYGFWNYGDVMHSYDAARHEWRYDIGGFAWDNTELSTDIWLWYSFLRSGRADIFKMAEAMTRHTGEVDNYHLGPYAGLGSRHNVNHWGDGSKEVRESQAILRRYYYYLTTDERTGDLMHEVALHAGNALSGVDPLREILPKSKYPTHARFGPDWVGLVGDWMTEWERTGDNKWKNRIMVGVDDFSKMQYGFYSGKDGAFGFDPSTDHIYQLEPGDIGYIHLATLMGGIEMGFELSPLLKDKEWDRLFLQYCSLFGAPQDEIRAAFGINAKLGDAGGDYARMPAYAAYITGDPKYAQRAWDHFLSARQGRFVGMRFEARPLEGADVMKPTKEIRSVSTNGTAQWCLNAIELLQLVGNSIPENNPLWEGNVTLPGKLIYTDDFSKPIDPKIWITEIEPGPGSTSTVFTDKGALMLDTRGGVTVWLNQVLEGNIQIEFDREVLVDSGRNDRLSDANLFWMATDPADTHFFTRNGKFESYDSLQLYYAGIGGNGNKTTRFRKYYGKGAKPLLKEYLDTAHLLQPNKTDHIRIIVKNGTTSLWVNGECYFIYADPAPLNSGYFGFRSTWSRQEIRNFSVYRLE